LGAFPFYSYSGPLSGIAACRWIARASRYVWRTRRPTLMLTRLPHLDLTFQRLERGRFEIELECKAVDEVAAELIRPTLSAGARVLVLSDSIVAPVNRCVPINRCLREAGLLAVRQ